MKALDALKKYSLIVADTADFEELKKFDARDATTNPSLILKTVQNPQYEGWFNKHKSNAEDGLLKLIVAFGAEIAKQVKRVSTEVDARLSYDTQATVAQARQMIALYQDLGVGKERILIKIASTWEGIAAAKILSEEGINCNLTLLFSLTQARACAAAKVTLISPFVGRVSDWFARNGAFEKADFGAADDPGVALVRSIYHFYKANAIDTEVMAASFRNTRQIKALAGCDLMTIAPTLLEQLAQEDEQVEQHLVPQVAELKASVAIAQQDFLRELTENPMAYDQLGGGIRNFIKDTETLEAMLKD